MKLIQTTSWYFPDSSGGVEVYLDGLVQGLNAQGIQSIVAAPRSGKEEDHYSWNGVDVYRYPLFLSTLKAEEREQFPTGGFEQFCQWLKAQNGDLYHQHSWRFGCGRHHLRYAHELGMPTVVTIHMPEAVCLRGTMMFQDRSPCDGQINSVRCGQCCGVPERVPNWATQALSQIPQKWSTPIELQLRTSKDIRIRQLSRTLSLPSQVSARYHHLMEMAQYADRIVAVCQWLYDALLLNGIPQEKLVLSRQGVTDTRSLPQRQRQPHEPLKIGYLGRWRETKGVQIIVEAVRRLPQNIPVELTIHAMLDGTEGRENRDRVLEIAATDPRIRVQNKLTREEVPKALAGFDIVAVPSQWLETGPLVVLESHAVGTPVIGSNRGGIAELVHHGVDGWLVAADDIEAWKDAITELAVHPEKLIALRQGIQSVRTMDDVAQEMTLLYQEVLQQHSPSH